MAVPTPTVTQATHRMIMPLILLPRTMQNKFIGSSTAAHQYNHCFPGILVCCLSTWTLPETMPQKESRRAEAKKMADSLNRKRGPPFALSLPPLTHIPNPLSNFEPRWPPAGLFMVRAHRTSPAPSRASVPVVSLDELRQSKKNGIQTHKHARSTRTKYGGELTRMRKWAGAYTTGAAGTVSDTSARLSGSGAVTVDPEFASAFSGSPKACSADALAMYLTFKCLHQERGQSTAEGARSAIKKYWEELVDVSAIAESI